ncbi:MAG: hypothetical protein M3220_22685 [Chloroflexota bacterium]|nr:hypothetical protein [Chloroflexota bacterium]
MPRTIETEEFWRDEFTVTEDEETKLQEYFLQQNQPLRTEAVARHLMKKEHSALAESLQVSNGSYNPTATYKVGDRVVFPVLNDEVGEVVGIREGQNERYGPFRVIKVQFDALNETHEFAAELSNDTAELIDVVEEPPMRLEELFARFGDYASEEVEAALEASNNFVQLGDRWLPRLMLVDFHEGHRNIADAMIDITGEPLPTQELLKEIPLEEKSPEAIKAFSLDYALSQDERFKNMGTEEEPRWYLQRLE